MKQSSACMCAQPPPPHTHPCLCSQTAGSTHERVCVSVRQALCVGTGQSRNNLSPPPSIPPSHPLRWRRAQIQALTCAATASAVRGKKTPASCPSPVCVRARECVRAHVVVCACVLARLRCVCAHVHLCGRRRACALREDETWRSSLTYTRSLVLLY